MSLAERTGRSPVSVDLQWPVHHPRSSVSCNSGEMRLNSSAMSTKGSSNCPSPQLCNVVIDDPTKREGKVRVRVRDKKFIIKLRVRRSRLTYYLGSKLPWGAHDSNDFSEIFTL